MGIKLRKWQEEAIGKALSWYRKNEGNRRFLINAAPGSGKTICASALALEMFNLDLIDRVIVIAPRVEVVKQWAQDFQIITGRHMGKIVASAGEYMTDLGFDLCLTWNSVQSLDPDMLEERARIMLNYGHIDDIVALDQKKGK